MSIRTHTFLDKQVSDKAEKIGLSLDESRGPSESKRTARGTSPRVAGHQAPVPLAPSWRGDTPRGRGRQSAPSDVQVNPWGRAMVEGVFRGYTRVSTDKQDGVGQRALLLNAGVPERNILTDTFSGRSMDRPGFKRLNKLLDEGDTLIIPSIWRVGRCDEAVEWLIHLYTKRGINFIILDNPWLGPSKSDMDPAIRNGILWFMGYMGKQYIEALKHATSNGMKAKMLTEGMKPGRKPIEPETVKLIRDYKAQGWPRAKIARVLNVGSTTVFQYTSDPEYNPAPPQKAASTIERELANGTPPAKDTLRVHRDRRLSRGKRNGPPNDVAALDMAYTFSGRWDENLADFDDDEPLPF